MVEQAETAFVSEHADALSQFWSGIRDHLLNWRSNYHWPPNAVTKESLDSRTRLQRQIRKELDRQGYLSKAAFDSVIRWGFGRDSGCSDQEIQNATRLAFRELKANHLAKAARELVKLPLVGISRASKVLALSDQQEFGIYDSRTGHGLSDLVDRAGRRIIPIPPGRVIAGDRRTKDEYCFAFERYTWVLRHLRALAREDSLLSTAFSRVADLEMAFFVRSRSSQIGVTHPDEAVPEHLRTIALHDEKTTFWTLGPGKKSKQFWAFLDGSAITVLTGNKTTPKTLKANEIDACLAYFGCDSFPLSNSKTVKDRDPRGLGEYFAQNFGSSVFASHFAALWVHQGLLKANLQNGAWWFQIR